MINAICDRCHEKIKDFDAEFHGLHLNFPDGISIDAWDLCTPCKDKTIEDIAKLIEEWKS